MTELKTLMMRLEAIDATRTDSPSSIPEILLNNVVTSAVAEKLVISVKHHENASTSQLQTHEISIDESATHCIKFRRIHSNNSVQVSLVDETGKVLGIGSSSLKLIKRRRLTLNLFDSQQLFLCQVTLQTRWDDFDRFNETFILIASTVSIALFRLRHASWLIYLTCCVMWGLMRHRRVMQGLFIDLMASESSIHVNNTQPFDSMLQPWQLDESLQRIYDMFPKSMSLNQLIQSLSLNSSSLKSQETLFTASCKLSFRPGMTLFQGDYIISGDDHITTTEHNPNCQCDQTLLDDAQVVESRDGDGEIRSNDSAAVNSCTSLLDNEDKLSCAPATAESAVNNRVYMQLSSDGVLGLYCGISPNVPASSIIWIYDHRFCLHKLPTNSSSDSINSFAVNASDVVIVCNQTSEHQQDSTVDSSRAVHRNSQQLNSWQHIERFFRRLFQKKYQRDDDSNQRDPSQDYRLSMTHQRELVLLRGRQVNICYQS